MEMHRLIVNLYAGGGRAREEWPKIERALKERRIQYRAVFTEGPTHGIALAHDALEEGYRRIVAVGGDGTTHEVINGLVDAETGMAPADIVLGILPIGTGNDLARHLGIPRDYRAACRFLQTASVKRLDLGRLEYMGNHVPMARFMINTAGLGFCTFALEKTRHLPMHMRGTLPYVLGLLGAIVSFRNQPIRIQTDQGDYNGKATMVVIANCSYFGGGMHIVPSADPFDGRLDLMVFDNVSKFEIIRSFPKVYRGGLESHPNVWMRRIREARISSPQDVLLQIEGEILGTTPVIVRSVPAAIQVIAGGLEGAE